MLDALHRAGHRWLKILFVLALAGSSTLFFIGSVVDKPPTLLVVIVGAILGVAIEWSYFTVSCDLTESISEGHKGGIFVNLLYTLVGGAASWFLFTNASLVVGWAPRDAITGLSRQQWAMIMAALIVGIIFMLSARRKPNKNQADLQAIARSVAIMAPGLDAAEQLALLSAIATAGSAATSKSHALPGARTMPTLPAPAEAQNGASPHGKGSF
jgi:bacteriorhodopsin